MKTTKVKTISFMLITLMLCQNIINIDSNIIKENDITDEIITENIIKEKNLEDIKSSADITADLFYKLEDNSFHYEHEKGSDEFDLSINFGIGSLSGFTYSSYIFDFHALFAIGSGTGVYNEASCRNIKDSSSTLSEYSFPSLAELCYLEAMGSSLIASDTIKTDYYFASNSSTYDPSRVYIDTTAPIMHIESQDGVEYGYVNDYVYMGSGMYSIKFVAYTTYSLRPTIFINSTSYHYDNIGVETYDFLDEIWLDQNPKDIVLNNPYYKLRVFDKQTRDVIYEDSEYQWFQNYRTVDINSLNLVNNANELVNITIYNDGTDVINKSVNIFPYSEKIISIEPDDYDYEIYDLYSNILEEGSIVSDSTELIYTPEYNEICVISLFDQNTNLLDFNDFIVYYDRDTSDGTTDTLLEQQSLEIQRGNAYSFKICDLEGNTIIIETGTVQSGNNFIGISFDVLYGSNFYSEPIYINGTSIDMQLIPPFTKQQFYEYTESTYEIFDIYNNSLENITLSGNELNYIPPYSEGCNLKLIDQNGQYVPFHYYNVYYNDTLLTNEVFQAERNSDANISVYTLNGTFITSDLIFIEEGTNNIAVELDILYITNNWDEPIHVSMLENSNYQGAFSFDFDIVNIPPEGFNNYFYNGYVIVDKNLDGHNKIVYIYQNNDILEDGDYQSIEGDNQGFLNQSIFSLFYSNFSSLFSYDNLTLTVWNSTWSENYTIYQLIDDYITNTYYSQSQHYQGEYSWDFALDKLSPELFQYLDMSNAYVVNLYEDHQKVLYISGESAYDYKTWFGNEKIGVIQWSDGLDDWTDASGSGCGVSIVDEVDGHLNVMELNDLSTNMATTTLTLSPTTTTGFYEFWTQTSQVSKQTLFMLMDDNQGQAVYLGFQSSKIRYYDTIWHDIVSVSDNQWYHLKISFDGSNDWYVEIDGVSYGPYNVRGTPTEFDKLQISTYTTNLDYQCYVDAIGFSQDNYILNDNLIPDGNVVIDFQENDYKVDGTLEWGTSESIDLNDWNNLSDSNCEVNVVDKFNHDDILELYDNNTSGKSYVQQKFNDTLEADNSIEFYWAYTGNDVTYVEYLRILLRESDASTQTRVYFMFNYRSVGSIEYRDPSGGYHTLATCNSDRLYHIKINLDDSENTFDFYLDNVLIGDDVVYYSDSATGVNFIEVDTRDEGSNHYHWIDSIGIKQNGYESYSNQIYDYYKTNSLDWGLASDTYEYKENYGIPIDGVIQWDENDFDSFDYKIDENGDIKTGVVDWSNSSEDIFNNYDYKFDDYEMTSPKTGVEQWGDLSSWIETADTFEVESEFGSHKNMLKIGGNDALEFASLPLSSTQTSGTYEFYFSIAQLTSDIYFGAIGDSYSTATRGNRICHIWFSASDNKIDFQGATNDGDLLTIVVDQIYHAKISFNKNGACTLTVDGNLLGSVTGNNYDATHFFSYQGSGSSIYRFDSLGFSWDSYSTGDNQLVDGWLDTSGSDCNISIIDEIDRHQNVIEIDDPSASNSCYLYRDFSSQTAGIEEFWIRSPDVSDNLYIRFYEGTTLIINIRISTDKIQYYYDPGGGHQWNDATGGSVSNDEWYHINIDFDCSTDTFNFDLNGVELDSGVPFQAVASSVDQQEIRTEDSASGIIYYLDTIGYSWDSYATGDNILTYTDGWVNYGVDILEIVDEGNHKDAMHVIADTGIQLYNVGNSYSTDTVEFYFMAGQTDNTINIYPFSWDDPGNYVCRIYFNLDGYIDFRGTTNDENIQTYNANQWYHIKTIWENNGDCKLYVDGDLISTVTGNNVNGEWFRIFPQSSSVEFWIDSIGRGQDGYSSTNNQQFYDFIDYSTGNTNVSVVEDLDGHYNVLELDDQDTSNSFSLNYVCTEFSTGTVDLFVRFTDITKEQQIHISDGSKVNGISIEIDNSKFQYYDTGYHDIMEIDTNVWYHLSISLNTYDWSIKIDGIEYGDYNYRGSPILFDLITFNSFSAHTNYQFYIDGIGISSENNYQSYENVPSPIIRNGTYEWWQNNVVNDTSFYCGDISLHWTVDNFTIWNGTGYEVIETADQITDIWNRYTLDWDLESVKLYRNGTLLYTLTDFAVNIDYFQYSTLGEVYIDAIDYTIENSNDNFVLGQNLFLNESSDLWDWRALDSPDNSNYQGIYSWTFDEIHTRPDNLAYSDEGLMYLIETYDLHDKVLYTNSSLSTQYGLDEIQFDSDFEGWIDYSAVDTEMYYVTSFTLDKTISNVMVLSDSSSIDNAYTKTYFTGENSIYSFWMGTNVTSAYYSYMYFFDTDASAITYFRISNTGLYFRDVVTAQLIGSTSNEFIHVAFEILNNTHWDIYINGEFINTFETWYETIEYNYELRLYTEDPTYSEIYLASFYQGNSLRDAMNSLYSSSYFNLDYQTYDYKVDGVADWGTYDSPILPSWQHTMDTFEIVEEMDGHENVLHLEATAGDNIGWNTPVDFTTSDNHKTIDFWIYLTHTDKRILYLTEDNLGNNIIGLQFQTDGMIDFGSDIDIMQYYANTWYHISMDIVQNGYSKLFVNQNLVSTDFTTDYPIEQWWFYCYASDTELYLDSIGFSDDGYEPFSGYIYDYYKTNSLDWGLASETYDYKLNNYDPIDGIIQWDENDFDSFDYKVDENGDIKTGVVDWSNSSEDIFNNYDYKYDDYEMFIPKTGVIQWGTSTSPDLTDWSYTDVDTFEVIPELNHKNTIHYIETTTSSIQYEYTELSSGEFTIEFWINLEQTNKDIYASVRDSSNAHTWLIKFGSDGFIDFQGTALDSDIQVYSANEWIHTKVIWTKSSDTKLYINNLLISTITSLNKNNQRFSIGVTNGGEFNIDALGFSWDSYIIGDNQLVDDWLDTSGLDTGVSTVDLGIHENVLEFYDDSTTYSSQLAYSFPSQITGSIEFWFSSDDVTDETFIRFYQNANQKILLRFVSDDLFYYNGSSYEKLADLSDNIWYHLRLDFDCNADTMDVWLDGVDVGSGLLFGFASTDITKIFINTDGANTDYSFYLDGLGFSWDSYTTEDNIPVYVDDWTYESYSDCSISTDNFGTHENVIILNDQSTTENCLLESTGLFSQTVGSVEFYWMTSDISKYGEIHLSGTGGNIYLYISSGNLGYYDGSGHNFFSPISNIWYHFRIDFDVSDDWHIWIDGVSQDGGVGYDYNSPPLTDIDFIQFITHNAGIDYQWYIDALGFSWDSYITADNLQFYDFHNPSYGNTNVSIVEELDRHYNVLKLDDQDSSNDANIQYWFTEQTSGVVDFWVYFTDVSQDIYCYIGDGGGAEGILLRVIGDYDMLYYYIDGWNEIQVMENNHWYNIHIEYDCSDDWHLNIDGVSFDEGEGLTFRETPTALDVFSIYTIDADSDYSVYLDGLGISGDSNYQSYENIPEPYITYGSFEWWQNNVDNSTTLYCGDISLHWTVDNFTIWNSTEFELIENGNQLTNEWNRYSLQWGNGVILLYKNDELIYNTTMFPINLDYFRFTTFNDGELYVDAIDFNLEDNNQYFILGQNKYFNTSDELWCWDAFPEWTGGYFTGHEDDLDDWILVCDTTEIVDYLDRKDVYHIEEATETSKKNYLEFTDQISGTIEFNIKEIEGRGLFILTDGTATRIQIRCLSTSLRFYYGDGVGGASILDYFFTSDFPNIKIIFDCETDKFSLWCDGILQINNQNFYGDWTSDTLNRVYIGGYDTSNPTNLYFDALKFSWDETYFPYYSTLENTTISQIYHTEYPDFTSDTYYYQYSYDSYESETMYFHYTEDYNTTEILDNFTCMGYTGLENNYYGRVEWWAKGTETYKFLLEDFGSGGYDLSFETSGVYSTGNGFRSKISSYNYLDDEWHHYHVFYNFDSKYLSIYIDGTFSFSTTLETYFGTPTLADSFSFWAMNSTSFYLDAIDYSGSEGYSIFRSMELNISSDLWNWYVYPEWESGYYDGSENDLTDWTLNCETTELVDYLDRKNVMHIIEPLSNSRKNYLEFGQQITVGTIEFNIIEVEDRGYFSAKFGGEQSTLLRLYTSSIQFYYGDGNGGLTSTTYPFTTEFPRIKLSFNSITDKISWWCDGVLVVDNENFNGDSDVDYIDRIWVGGYDIARATELYIDAISFSWDEGYFPWCSTLENTTYSMLNMTSENFLAENIMPYREELYDYTPAYYLYNITDLYGYELEYSNLLPTENEINYIPPVEVENFISLADQQGNYLNWELFKIQLNGSLTYSNLFMEEINEYVNISIWDRFDNYLTSTIHKVGRDDNYISLTINLYSLKIYNQQGVFLHVNITQANTDYFWSEWIAPNYISEFRLIPDQYNVTITEYEEGESSTTYSLNFANDDILLISSFYTLQSVILSMENLNVTLDEQFTYISLNFTNVDSAIGNQTTIISINFNNVNTTFEEILLSQSNSFNFANTSLNLLLLNQENNFEFYNSTLNSLYTLNENSFTFINSTAQEILSTSEFSFTSINGTLGSINAIALQSFEYINSTLDESFAYMAQNFTFIQSEINSNQLEILTQFNIISSNITNNSLEIINNVLAINSTISSLVAELSSNIFLVNDTIYTAVLNTTTQLSIQNTEILGNLSITFQQNEFLTDMLRDTMFSELLNWTGVNYNYSILESQIDTFLFVNKYRDQAVEVLLNYQDQIDRIILGAGGELSMKLPSSGVDYKVYSVDQDKYLSEWEDVDTQLIDIGFFKDDFPTIPDPIDPNDIDITVSGYESYIWVGLVLVVVVIGVGYIALRWRNQLDNPKKRKKTGIYSGKDSRFF